VKRFVGTALAAGLSVLGAGCEREHARFADFRPDSIPAEHRAGAASFVRHCARCHGINAVGTDSGPALLHEVYGPSHHGDVAFELAVRNGVRAHHWRFGDMPAQPQVTSDEVRAITQYVRWLQELSRGTAR
jgi:mono/diheme cytochrome c family protein